jgi:glycosyltransferase involved in cell wall biosynthesis
MNNQTPIMIDATTMYKWRDLDPVGIIRLERLLASHLRFGADVGPVEYILWDGGYRPVTRAEHDRLDLLLEPSKIVGDADEASSNLDAEVDADVADDPVTPLVTSPLARSRRVKASVRTTGLKALARLPDHLRPFAEQAAWSSATFAVESARHARRLREDRKIGKGPKKSTSDHHVRHTVNFTRGGDLMAFGLGWEYLDHEALYKLKHDFGIRIHMPAFDLIPVTMPQMNAGQSHLVHRFYAEMAHYADSITSISYATTDAIREFYAKEELPTPYLATNQLPGFDPPDRRNTDQNRRRHRLAGEPFVLTVSTIEVRKNHLLLAKLWTDFARRGVAVPRLVIVGKMGWDINELVQWVAHAPELDKYVTMFGDVEDDELVEMYRDCEFTVFPSRVEGWGLPITESLTYGKACVHAIDPAQFEASQDLMPALHPDDFLGWRDEIERMALDVEYRRGLETIIGERFARRTPAEYCATFAAILAERRATTPSVDREVAP